MTGFLSSIAKWVQLDDIINNVDAILSREHIVAETHIFLWYISADRRLPDTLIGKMW